MALCGLAVATVAMVGIVRLRREKADVWVFFAVTIFVAPALMLMVFRPPLVYQRYFYIPILFFLLLASYVFAQMTAVNGRGRVLAIAGLCIVIAGNVAVSMSNCCASVGGIISRPWNSSAWHTRRTTKSSWPATTILIISTTSHFIRTICPRVGSSFCRITALRTPWGRRHRNGFCCIVRRGPMHRRKP